MIRLMSASNASYNIYNNTKTYTYSSQGFRGCLIPRIVPIQFTVIEKRIQHHEVIQYTVSID
jgi:hypothetical protein